MSRIKESVQKLGVFFGEVSAEFRKTTWPARRELIESTVVVITFIVLLAAVVLVCDWVIRHALTLVRA